jgi:hypothetical protein
MTDLFFISSEDYKPRPGDIGAVRTDGWSAKAIQFGTISEINHIVICSKDPNFLIEANPKGGVEVNPISKYKNIAWSRNFILTDEQRDILVNKAMSYVGEEYGFLAIGSLAIRISSLGLATKIPPIDWALGQMAKRDGVICSELGARTFEAIGVKFSDKPAYSTTPKDIGLKILFS